MRIYLIRHGQTDLNRLKCYYGITEAVLTEDGIQQAKQLGNYLAGQKWDRIVVSPLKRAMDTAVYVTGKTVEEFETDEKLQEQNFGIFEGKTYGQLCQEYPEELKAWNADFSNYRIPGGESFSDVRARVESWVEEISKEEGQMLVVAHKGTFGHMLAAMLHLPVDGYWNFVFEQGCYSVVDLEDGYAILRTLNQSID